MPETGGGRRISPLADHRPKPDVYIASATVKTGCNAATAKEMSPC